MIPSQAGVIVIDHVGLVRQQISTIFSAEGIRKITELSKPEEALKFLETKPCHLIVCELHFPDLGALEFLKKIRSHSFPRMRCMGFVVLTADQTRESVESMMNAGADDYILKPLTPNCIQSRIAGLLMKIPGDV
jgi:DNA-binding NarL/FixJ family response regulator